MSALSDTLQPGDTLLLGTDLVKDTGRLVRAYDDSAGVTARFNRNVLAVVNRELDADFDLDAFEHVARWNADEERIEMWLRAGTAQRVRVAALDLTVDFAAGEEMLTEVSCKFRPEGVARRIGRRGPAPHPLVDRPGGRLRAVAVHEMTDTRRSRWRAARPKVAGLHLDSAACSRQSFAVIDAAAQHARHEAEVGGYVAAEAAAPVLDAGRAAVAALTGMSGVRRRLHHRLQPRARPAAEQLAGAAHRGLPARRVRPEPGGHGGATASTCARCRPTATAGWSSTRRPRSWRPTRRRWCT